MIVVNVVSHHIQISQNCFDYPYHMYYMKYVGFKVAAGLLAISIFGNHFCITMLCYVSQV